MPSHLPHPRPPHKTLLVEDSPQTREFLVASLGNIRGLEVAATAETVSDAIAAFVAVLPRIVVLDLGLRGGSGLDLLREIKRRAPQCLVLVFTGYDQEPYRQHCLAAGADFFFSKNRQQDALLQQLEKFADEIPIPAPGAGGE